MYFVIILINKQTYILILMNATLQVYQHFPQYHSTKASKTLE